LLSNRLLRSVLAGKGYEVVYSETDGNHSSYYWMLRLPEGLQAVLGRGGAAPHGSPDGRVRDPWK
jgi:enterochelin esterase-like enzyme